MNYDRNKTWKNLSSRWRNRGKTRLVVMAKDAYLTLLWSMGK